MLSQQELDNLLTILKEPNKPFEQIAQTFYRSFTKPDQFKAGCVICMLIQDNLLTDTALGWILPSLRHLPAGN